MRIFFRKLIIFSLPVILLTGCLEYNLGKIPNIYSLKRELLETNIADTEVIITGSSYEFEGVNPEFLDLKSFNLALPAQSIRYDTAMVLKYLDRMPNLKLVIAPVSYFTFWSDYKSTNTVFYERFWDLLLPADIALSDFQRYSFIALYNRNIFKYIKHGFNAGPDTDWAPVAMNKSGWMRGSSPEPKSDEQGRKAVEYHNSIASEEAPSYNMELLNSFFNELKKRNIAAVMMTSPTFYTYSDNIDKEKYRIMQEKIKELSERNNVPYYNYFLDKRFTEEDFRDIDHLNSEGAEKYSKIINEEILKNIF